MLSYSRPQSGKPWRDLHFSKTNRPTQGESVTTSLFSIPHLLACRYERESLDVVEMSDRLQQGLTDLLAANPQGANVLDLVQPQDFPTLENALKDFNRTATCLLNAPGRTSVQWRCHPDPEYPSTHGLLIGEVVEDFEDQIRTLEARLTKAENERNRFVNLNGLLVHDLRNALQILISHTDLAKRSIENGQYHDLSRRLDVLSTSGSEMAQQLEELNKYLRLEVGEYPREMTDFNELISGCTRRAKVRCERPLNIHHTATFPTLICERQLVDELFSNLIGNAIRYSHTDPIQIEIGVEEAPSAQPVFFVRDSGIGIHPEDLPHVFQPLRRSDRTRLNSKGSGMGLAYVKQIVERHEGQIWLESTINKGTTVHFSLGPMRD